jgi:hypothetical protein
MIASQRRADAEELYPPTHPEVQKRRLTESLIAVERTQIMLGVPSEPIQTGMHVALRKMRANIVPDTSMSSIAEAFDDLLNIVKILDRWQQGSDKIHFRALVGKEDGDTLGKLVTAAISKAEGTNL